MKFIKSFIDKRKEEKVKKQFTDSDIEEIEDILLSYFEDMKTRSSFVKANTEADEYDEEGKKRLNIYYFNVHGNELYLLIRTHMDIKSTIDKISERISKYGYEVKNKGIESTIPSDNDENGGFYLLKKYLIKIIKK